LAGFETSTEAQQRLAANVYRKVALGELG